MQENGGTRWTGGGTWKPEGKRGYVTVSWPSVGLLLDEEGGTLDTPFGPDVAFGWHEVERVERIKGLFPWDRGVRFVLSRDRGGEKFNFFTLTRGREEEVLGLADKKGVTVNRNKHRSWLF